MTNEEKAREIANKYCVSDYKIDNSKKLESSYDECYCSALAIAEWKDKELKKHEQSLLYTIESILDKLYIEGKAREIVLNEFKEHLIFKKNE